MSWLQALLLALIQGVTEFLPISSSAHLILLPYLVGWRDQGLAFDIATNTGTLLAVMVYFRRDLWALARGVLHPSSAGVPEPDAEGMTPQRLLIALAVGTVPVAVTGLLFYDFFAGPARHPALIATASIFFGLALLWADRSGARSRELATLTWREAALIGAAQALALIPGTSRSGVTLTAALFLGLSRPAAARFAFLLAIPVGSLAAAKDLQEVFRGGVEATQLPMMAVALGVSAVSAYVVIDWLLAWLRRKNMTPFVIYRIFLGLLVLAFWCFE